MKAHDSQQLISKIQYKEFEPGEFSEEKPRTLAEPIALITQFPQTPQRDNLEVSLTNPSVTIQDLEGNYLKLAHYYNNKFVLHYFSTDKVLYTKSISDYGR